MSQNSKFLRYIKQNQEIYGNDLFLEFDRINTKNDCKISLENLDYQFCQCQIAILERDKKKIVIKDVNLLADIIFVSDISLKEKDLLIEPRIGSTSDLFDKILNAINLSRADVHLCNILKSCTPNNNYLLSSAHLCEPLLQKQLSIINPQLIVALGSTIASTLLKALSNLLHLLTVQFKVITRIIWFN